MSSLTKLAICAVLAITFAGLPAAHAADAIGRVSAFKGFPTASGTGGARALEKGSALFEGDTIKSSGGGNVQITLRDGTRLVVGPASQLVLESYLLRNASTAKKVAVKALRGYFRFISGSSPKSAYSISTANATVGIRGTGFDLRVRGLTLAAVLQGAIGLRGDNGQAVEAAAGCGVAEAGGGSTQAALLSGRAKANRLQQDFPFVVNQGSLLPPFQLPVGECKAFLAQYLDLDGPESGARRLQEEPDNEN